MKIHALHLQEYLEYLKMTHKWDKVYNGLENVLWNNNQSDLGDKERNTFVI
jgi:hypothetical protein